MCLSGHSSWLSTDAEACFLGPDLALKQCWCPVTHCVETMSGYTCQLTAMSITIIAVLGMIWVGSIILYLYAAEQVDELHVSAARVEHAKFSDRLFGVYPICSFAEFPPLVPGKKAANSYDSAAARSPAQPQRDP